MKRRTFIKKTSLATAGLGLAPAFIKINSLQAQTSIPDVVWIENGEPANLLKSGIVFLFWLYGDWIFIQ